MVEDRGDTRRRLRRHLDAVTILTAALAAAGAASTAAVWDLEALAGPRSLPPVVLVAAFAMTELALVHIEREREAHSLSFNEVPLLLGLAYAAPAELVVARVLGSAVTLVAIRRQSIRRTAFNLSLFALETALAVLVFRGLLGDARVVDPRGWAAAMVVSVLLTLLGTAAVTAAITLSSGWPGGAATRRVLAYGAAATVGSGALGVIAVLLHWLHPWAVPVLLAGTGGVCLVVYRAYVNLAERHRSLEALHGFTRDVQQAIDPGDVPPAVLGGTRRLLRAEHACVVLAPSVPGDPVLLVVADDEELRSRPVTETSFGSFVADLLDGGTAQLVPAHRCPPEVIPADERGAVAAPVHLDGDLAGILLVSVPKSRIGRFDAESVQLLATVAHHASATFQNGRLVTRLQAEAERRVHLATHDAVTGLPNVSGLTAELDQHLGAAAAHPDAEPPDAGTAVLLLGLDDLKDITDTFGRAVGDVLLLDLCRRLRDAMPEDVVVARVGQHDLAVVRHGDGGQVAATGLAGLVLATLEPPFVVDGASVALHGRVGVAMHPGHGDDAASLLRSADLALTTARRATTAVEWYSGEGDRFDAGRLSLVAELPAAIASGQLRVHYQPKVDLATGRVTSAEALVRWEHPVRGSLPPASFIPAAESTAAIGPLTLAVLRDAARQCRSWLELGYDLSVAVNLSARNLVDRDLPEQIAELLDEVGLEPHRLTLELTETTAMADDARATTVLHELHGLGYALSVDDFGTGYSSLSHLRRLPVDEIKIDRSFVSRMDRDDQDAAIVTGILGLAASLGLRTVAEGVETQEVWEQLLAGGCDQAQGYLISRPVPAEELLVLLASSHAGQPVPPVGRG